VGGEFITVLQSTASAGYRIRVDHLPLLVSDVWSLICSALTTRLCLGKFHVPGRNGILNESIKLEEEGKPL